MLIRSNLHTLTMKIKKIPVDFPLLQLKKPYRNTSYQIMKEGIGWVCGSLDSFPRPSSIDWRGMKGQARCIDSSAWKVTLLDALFTFFSAWLPFCTKLSRSEFLNRRGFFQSVPADADLHSTGEAHYLGSALSTKELRIFNKRTGMSLLLTGW